MAEVSEPTEYLAQRVRDAIAADPRTGELGLEVAVAGDGLIVRGVVGSEERRAAIAAVAGDAVPGIDIRNETVVKEVHGPQGEESIG